MLEVGPAVVRLLPGDGGIPGPLLDPALVRAALDWVDDPVGLYGELPVRVADLWRAVVSAAAGEGCDQLVVVHPDDWPSPRLARILAAANAVCGDVAAVRRSDWAPGRDSGPPAAQPAARWRLRARMAAPGAIGMAAMVAASAALAGQIAPQPPPASPTAARMVEEGRVAIEVPSGWAVTRVTAGRGSRRLEVASPDDPGVALHITQSHAPEMTLARTAEAFAAVIADHPDGQFAGLRADAHVAGRPAVVYREVRPGRVIEWAVVIAGATRIGVGCQSRPGEAEAVRAACEGAVLSARERGTDPGR